MKTRCSAERVIDAPADVVYRCLADYTQHHRPGAFLPPAFSNQEVLSGGVGDGTVIRVSVSLAGRTNTMTAHISEPEPGRVLVEDATGVRTTFTVSSPPACCARSTWTNSSAWSATLSPRPPRYADDAHTGSMPRPPKLLELPRRADPNRRAVPRCAHLPCAAKAIRQRRR